METKDKKRKKVLDKIKKILDEEGYTFDVKITLNVKEK